ncbi:unnamed protein product [Caenorhabditis auriculariae]|uniref:Uncharacterized protein n=1 Tax=Caenorhabditis auriculariae TaxID=2777116 RepID=A0A8S1HLZ9_9PELO|nr:unnamed protein product [Caenorhabditis auriculariae]
MHPSRKREQVCDGYKGWRRRSEPPIRFATKWAFRRQDSSFLQKLVDGPDRMDQKPPPDEYLDRFGNVVVDDDDDNSKSLHVPPLFSSRRVSSRKSIRSLSEDEYQYASVKTLFINFCARTSSHGVPFVGTSSFFGPFVWLAVFLCALMFFLFQTYWTMSDYLQYRTIIEMQLRFEAATVCNLNAFKYSELIRYEEIKAGFEYWERVINARNMREQLRKDGSSDGGDLKKINVRKRHDGDETGAEYQPVFVRCTCMNTEQCVPNRNPLETNASVCMCFEDVTRGLIWPCYPTTAWTVKKCTQCSISNTCADPDGPNVTKTIKSTEPRECLCQSISHHCMVHPKGEIRWWNPNNYTVYPITEPPPPIVIEEEEAFGYADLNDAGAITTQTKENLIFLVSALPREIRRNLSYTLNEFVLRCSFNSKDCDMANDFKLHIDPEYGNCYTFNFNDSVELKNTRAGPMYGLRLLLDVHQDDYMPTTEAAGVRLVVHEQDQEPFPDTFGYSAPTGFISSFGLKTKVLHRLDGPYGQCSDTYRPEVYIYDEHYSPEGCHRNCFQLKVIEDCKCGDPRFPLPSEDQRYCSAKSVADRQCLSNLTSVAGGYRHLHLKCECMQPCHENVFETAYSAAAWPSVNFRIGDDCPAVLDIFNDSEACTEYYRVNTAYIEIYYEQLNFETLKETAGYTLVNLFSDFGGNIGLWIGFSVITFLELLEFLCEVGYYCLYIKPMRLHRKLLRRRNQEQEDGSPPRVINRILYSPRSGHLRRSDDVDDDDRRYRLKDHG